MGNENITKFMISSGEYITNINHTLKGINLYITINFIYFDHCDLIITSNKVASFSDLSVVENYIRNINFMNSNDIQTACLSQFKSYLIILGILLQSLS